MYDVDDHGSTRISLLLSLFWGLKLEIWRIKLVEHTEIPAEPKPIT